MKRFRQGYQRALWRRSPVLLSPDFLVRGTRTPRVVWGLLATAGVVLAIGAMDLLDLREQASAQRDRLARWEAQRQAMVRPAVVLPSQGRLQVPPQGQTAAWRIAEALAYPWGRILVATEGAVTADVQWLAFEHDSARPELRLEGLSPDSRAALKAVDTLAALPDWSSVVLTRLAGRQVGGTATTAVTADAAAIGTLQRFEITAQLRVPAPAPATSEP